MNSCKHKFHMIEKYYLKNYPRDFNKNSFYAEVGAIKLICEKCGLTKIVRAKNTLS